MRYATCNAPLDTVQAYLPDNYRARVQPDGLVLISGTDRGGWTLDDYVIPRLASGLIYAAEVAADHVVGRDPLACRVRWHDTCEVLTLADGSYRHTANNA
jgi:hypothetical protein